MTIAEYFCQPSSPMANSPTGLAMRFLLRERPDIPFEVARRMVNEIGASAAQSPQQCAKLILKKLATADMSDSSKRSASDCQPSA
jgi:hypothetical protein